MHIAIHTIHTVLRLEANRHNALQRKTQHREP